MSSILMDGSIYTPRAVASAFKIVAGNPTEKMIIGMPIRR